MASYEDMTKDANGIMYMSKYTDSTNSKANAFKLYNLTFKAAPKSGVNLTHNWTQQRAYDAEKDAQTDSVKSSSKVEMKHGDAKWVVTAANDKYAVNVTGPLVKDDWEVEGGLLWEDKIGKERKFEAAAEVESPDMSGTKTKFQVAMTHKMYMAKPGDKAKDAETSVAFDACLAYEKDLLVGVAAEHDLAELSQLDFAVAKKDDGNKYWAGYSHMDQFVKAGCLLKYDKGFTHAYEARYKLKDADDQKFMGMQAPVSVVGAGKYGMGDSAMTYMVELGADVHAQAKFTHKVDKNWSVAVHNSYDCNASGK